MAETPTVYRTEVYIVTVKTDHPSLTGKAPLIRGVFYSVAEADSFILENGYLAFEVDIVPSKLLYTDESLQETQILERDQAL